MIADHMSRKEIIDKYSKLADPLFRYIPWLQSATGTKVSSIYKGDGIDQQSISFPVYDASLLNFVSIASKTELMDKNYVYVYTRHHIKTIDDEKNFIAHTKLRDMDALAGILSKYVLGGRTKGILWNQAVENGIFLQVLLRMKELLEYREQADVIK